MKVKIYGAGSIGNHLAFASRSMGWDVLICDIEQAALERTKKDIYPSRYGSWDSAIELKTVEESVDISSDIVFIGTPPDSHIDITIDILQKFKPKLILIEKPLAGPSLERCQELYELSQKSETIICVGYNHVLGKNTVEAERILRKNISSKCVFLEAGFREYWGGIFRAHPWLAGPHESYLGDSQKGGGASGEHSHAINIWQHFASILDIGRITEVQSFMDFVEDERVAYDRYCHINVQTEKGYTGSITQDVLSEPSKKMARVQFKDGFLEWHVNRDKKGDAVVYQFGENSAEVIPIKKTRPDDFKWEVEHIQEIIEGKIKESPISLERGLDSMMVLAAAHLSFHQKSPVVIDYNRGYRLDAIEPR